jgi:sugar phosphate isomerase/epimerase
MRFALSTGSLYTYGLDRVFALAAEAGFDGIEVLVDHRFDTRQPTYLRRLMDRHGLPVLSVHAPFRPRRLAAWPKTQPESIAATAELARAVGAEVIVAHLPYGISRAYARWLRNDLRTWQQAHPVPVVAVENMPLKWVRWWPFAPLEMWRMNGLEEWGAFPHLTLDATHLGTKGLDPLMVYQRVRERVAHVHLSNARWEGRRVKEHRRLEDGFLPLDALISRLAQDGYAGIATVELHPDALEAEDEEKARAHLGQQIAFCRQHSLADAHKPRWRAVLRQIAQRLDESGVAYKVVGGASATLHGVPLPVKDLDIETDAEGAYRLQALFPGHVVEPVALCESETYRSHFGRFDFDGVAVEVMGDLHRREGERWVPTAATTETTVDLDGGPVRVSWLEEEVLAYIRRGRLERAAQCLSHCDQDRLLALLCGEQDTGVL